MSFVPQNAKLWISVIALSAMLALLYFASNSTWNTFTLQDRSSNEEVNLDGCYHVYLDVGTNVGIQVCKCVTLIIQGQIIRFTFQIRKLYEAKLYPNAPIHSAFDKYFHRKQETLPYICVVGFEPNPKHEEWLISKCPHVY